MSYHITVSVVHNNEIELLSVDSFHQFILYFVSTHLRFQVVSSYFRRRNQDALFSVIRSFTTTVEEESYVSILFRFSNVQLSLALSRQIFSQCILNIFLIEKNMYAFERCIIRSHAVVLQARNDVHALFRHILLSQHYGQLFRTVVTIVEEDNYITFLNGSVEVTIYNRLDKFVRHTFVIRFLHSLNHIGSYFTFAVYQQVISHFHTFPTFVAIHCIETTYDRSNLTC